MPSVASTSVDIAGPPPETKIRRVEVAEGEHGIEQDADEIQVRHQRIGHMREPAQAGGAIHRGRLVQFLRDRHPSGQQDDRPERHVLPDIGADVARQPHPVIIQIDRAVDAEQQLQQVVEHAPLAVHEPVDRYVGGQRRRRPRQDEDHEQRLDPPALAHEEA